jgi:4-amino-4-deoxy-L-arabinose transferase-like glycosyltransferase
MERRRALFIAAALLASAIFLAGAARRQSLTVDEAHYIGVGKHLVETGDWGLKGALLHPPLPFYLSSVLLFGVEIPESVWRAPHQDERGRALCRALPGNRALLLSRIPGIALTLLLFGLVFAEARRAFGKRAGLLAVLLAAFEPNLLAHGSLATPDLPLAALFFLAVLRVRRLREEGSARNTAIAGAALGLAFLSKYNALLLLAIVPIAALADRAPPRFFVRLVLAFLAALLVLYAAYLPLAVRGGKPFLGERLLPRPYEEGIEFQRRANTGHHAFFLGEISDQGWRAYYPVAWLVKTPIPFLLLFAIGAGLLLRERRRGDIAWFLLPPALFFLFFVFASRINIGVRYVLPVAPFFAAIGGHAAASARGKWSRRGVYALAIWLVAGTAAAYPHFLSYFNEAAGGPEGGARILADSNIDWGQDLPGLKDFLERKGYEGAYLAYFGNDDPERYGIRYRFLPGWIYSPPPRVYEESLLYHPDPEIVAVSRMLMQGVWLPDRDLYAWLERYPRIGTIGHSILVFDIRGDPEAHENLARAYRAAGHHALFRDEIVLAERARNAGR